MAYWWDDLEGERYWCEITDRPDIGVDLKCPQLGENGKPFWSYSFINEIADGDIVFHYSTRVKSFVGTSRASAPVRERAIIWKSHGGLRGDAAPPEERPGWFLSLTDYVARDDLPSLARLREPDEDRWIREWISARERQSGTVYAPFQRYKGQLRAAQGYLAKMPLAFVDRWTNLAPEVPAAPSGFSEETASFRYRVGDGGTDVRLKSESDYVALVTPGKQVRTRSHERLVRLASEHLGKMGAHLVTAHPIDLKMHSPNTILFEAKTVGKADPIFAIRAAVGQLFEYSHFVGPADAALCVLLDARPHDELIDYVENRLNILIAWIAVDKLEAGPVTEKVLFTGLDREAPSLQIRG